MTISMRKNLTSFIPATIAVSLVALTTSSSAQRNQPSLSENSQARSADSSHAAKTQAQAKEYRLGPQDVISVLVVGQPTMSAEQVKISSSGKIQLPVIGMLNVKDKTVEQVAFDITKALRAELNNPQVTVTLLAARPQLISVLGVVSKPGIYDLKPNWRVTDILALTGGLTGKAEAVEATLTRADGKVLPLNLPLILSNSNRADNVTVQDGDTLQLVARTIPISVAGQVTNPGNYDAPLNSQIAEAIILAGGPSKSAALSKATVKRADGTILSVNLRDAMTSLDSISNIKLQAKDFILVPEAKEKVMLLGAVQKPGFVDIEDGTKLSIAGALALVGGATPKAALTKTVVKHADGTSVPIDLHKVVFLGDPAANIDLASGDTVTIPVTDGRVSIIGAVQRSGSYEIPDAEQLQVSDVIALAGGVMPKAALTKATLTHSDGTMVPVDLFKVLSRNEQNENLPVASGDVITVPESKGIAVLGEVTKPGPYNIEEGNNPHLTDIIALVGGLSGKLDTSRIAISRRSPAGKLLTLEIDPIALLEKRDFTQNAQIYDGDLITVSSTKSPVVFISGEVKNAGSFEVKPGDGVPEVITRAGGPTDTAALTKVMVQRGDKTLTVDVRDALAKGQTLDFPLQEGDFIVVPQNLSRVLVMPSVNKPGYYPIPEGGKLTVGEALVMAGGPKDRAKLWEVAILRQTPAGVERQILPLGNIQAGQIAPLNQELQSGDILYVPEGKQSSSVWSKLAGSIGILSLFR